MGSRTSVIEKIMWVNARSNRIDPIEGLRCIPPPFSQRWTQWHYKKVKGFAQGCCQLEIRHHKTAFFMYNQKYFMSSQDQNGPIRWWPKTQPLTLGRWPLYIALYLQLIFSLLASAAAPRAVGSEWDAPCREWPANLFIRAQGSCVWNDSTFVLIGVTLTLGTHFSLSCLPCSLNQDSDSFEFFTFSLSLLEEPLGHL